MKIEEKSIQNISDILRLSINLKDSERVLVIYDDEYELTSLLKRAYEAALINHAGVNFLNFNLSTRENILAEFSQLSPSDLVVLIQSTNFRLDDFRIRLHLFNLKLKVMEHVHLARNDASMFETYIDSLAYDVDYLYTASNFLCGNLDNSQNLKIISKDVTLSISGPLEKCKKNIGDYTNMENIGGTYPIGEVFTESKDLTNMNGSIYIYAFADEKFEIKIHEPFRIDIVSGTVTGWGDNTPDSFKNLVTLVSEYERPLIREIGFGLNRAISIARPLGDITAFERIYGMHLSLGEKHSVFKKENIRTNKSKFHIDIFPVVCRVITDSGIIYDNGKYLHDTYFT